MIQERIKNTLDEHFQSLLDDEWKHEFSIYDIGARLGSDSKIKEIIVWAHSKDIITHCTELFEKMHLDHESRTGHGEQEPIIQKEDTVIARLFKPVDTPSDGEVHIVINLFQVFNNETEASEAKAKLDGLCLEL